MIGLPVIDPQGRTQIVIDLKQAQVEGRWLNLWFTWDGNVYLSKDLLPSPLEAQSPIGPHATRRQRDARELNRERSLRYYYRHKVNAKRRGM